LSDSIVTNDGKSVESAAWCAVSVAISQQCIVTSLFQNSGLSIIVNYFEGKRGLPDNFSKSAHSAAKYLVGHKVWRIGRILSAIL